MPPTLPFLITWPLSLLLPPWSIYLPMMSLLLPSQHVF
uniref:Uncharacterized protein n=2 Tax=Picea TaxID=3328 RepID=A0A101M5R6_PICGL|nr:hypothetical protein ABT39_MTgene1162 [Picea glauca]QHR88800.1 hypothetical protein Q903MT_gene2815 [Picea sitchensis]QHR91722.1 hypothetical protein Q903MT_gene5758 [Picea sitchensis]